MAVDRRKFVTGLGAALPLGVTASCARAATGDWPGPDTPDGTLPRLPIGMNLSSISDYSPGFPFRNLMLGSRAWMTRNALGGGPWDTGQGSFFEFDPDGYPLEVPLTTPGSKGVPQQVFTLLPNVLTPGRYILLYDGEGSFDAFLGTRIVAEHPGRVVLDMRHDPNLVEGLAIRRSKRGNHLRNIRIVAENDDPTTMTARPFRDDMLAFCKPFHAIRFMDWLATNNSIEDEWSSRRRPTFYTMSGTAGDVDGFWGPPLTPYQRRYSGGIAHELVIQLANTLQIDPWICIPHRATDDYIRRCSELYRDKLDPGRRLYLEYSNEVWNWGFNQAHWMLRSEWAGQAVEARGKTAWEMKDGKRSGTGHPERMGALFNRAFGLWLKEWPGKARQRVTTVCAIQAGWTDASLRTIGWCHEAGLTDAVATAAYFGPDQAVYDQWERRGAALTVDEVFASMRGVLAEQGGHGSVYQIATRARDLGLAFMNYEGGQHLQPAGQQDKPYMPALKAAQTHPEMYRCYVENLRQQRRLGSQLFCAFASISQQGLRWGSWGVKESYSQPDSASPKLRALLDCNT